MKRERTYLAIDMDPLTTNLVVGGASRTEKTICLAVSPSPFRPQGCRGGLAFEVVRKMKEVNTLRLEDPLSGNLPEAPLGRKGARGRPAPQGGLHRRGGLATALYMWSTAPGLYQVYLKYIAPEDIHAH